MLANWQAPYITLTNSHSKRKWSFRVSDPRLDTIRDTVQGTSCFDYEVGEGQTEFYAEETRAEVLEMISAAVVAQTAKLTSPENGIPWIDWKGGNDRPVSANRIVETRRRGGHTAYGRAENHHWFWADSSEDIIAYRVLG